MAKEIAITTQQELPIPENLVIKAAQASLSLEGIEDNYELSLVFCDDEFIQNLNREYRKLDKPTDVLSFGLDEEEEKFPEVDDIRTLGDIIISIPTATRQAKEQGGTLQDEIIMLVVHGILHILGYNDEYEEEHLKMHTRQREILEDIRSILTQSEDKLI